MTFARVTDDTITVPYRVPNVLRTDDGDVDLRSMDPALLAAHGIHEVVRTPRPDDTATTTHDRTIELVDGVPTVTWTARDKTPDELAADAARAASTIRQTDLKAAVSTLRTWADDAAGVTVTNTNNTAVTAVLLSRTATFWRAFADLLVEQYGEG